jgi:hypothetical protein
MAKRHDACGTPVPASQDNYPVHDRARAAQTGGSDPFVQLQERPVLSRRHLLTVIHRTEKSERVLGTLPADFRHHRSLDPFVSWLLRDGISEGVVQLIDPESGKVLTERTLRPARQFRRS